MVHETSQNKVKRSSLVVFSLSVSSSLLEQIFICLGGFELNLREASRSLPMARFNPVTTSIDSIVNSIGPGELLHR